MKRKDDDVQIDQAWEQLWFQRHRSESRNLDALQQRLSYRFKTIHYLFEALTHRSALNVRSKKNNAEGCLSNELALPWNERIEFLGDAVLSLCISSFLWRHDSSDSEGDLSRKRSFLVNEKILAQVAREISLGQSILLGRGEDRSGGRQRDALLADALEAVIGAVFLDGGFSAASLLVSKLFSPFLNSPSLASQCDFKTQLQEWSQDRYKIAPHYRLVSSSGPDHAKEFTVEVVLGKTVLGRGSGLSKKRASQEAAELALETIKSPDLHIIIDEIEQSKPGLS